MDTIIIDRPDSKEAIAHYFELPSTEKTIACFHACTGFPVKETRVKANKAGNYVKWAGLSVNTVPNSHLESDETQKVHIKGLRQGIRSTKGKTI